MHDALLFTPLKKLSYILIQLISFSFEKSTSNFSIFWYVVNKLALLAPFALCLGLLQIRDKWTSNDSETNLTKKNQIYPAIKAVAFVGFFPSLFIFYKIFWIFLQDRIRKISQCKTVILISNRTFLRKIVGNVLERCTKFFAPPNNLPILL